MEKIRLLELDIDVEKLSKKAADGRKQLEFLKNESKFFQASIKEGDGLLESYRDSLAQMEKQGKKTSKEYQILEKNLAGLSERQEKNRQKLELTNSELRKSQQEYRKTNRQLDVYNKTVEKELGIIAKTDGSIDQLNQAIVNNRKVYRGLTKEQRDNAEVGGRLLTLIQEQDKEYKDLQVSIGTTQVQVGNYKDQIKEALAESSSFSTTLDAQIMQIPIIGSSLSFTTKFLRGYAQGQITAAKAITGTTKALRIFKVALISTGIGAILVALGLFATAMAKSQRVTDFFSKALAPLKGGFEAIIGIIQDLAFNIRDISSGAFSQFKDNFTIVQNTFLNGIDKMRLAWNKLTGDQEEAAELQARINERTKETEAAVARTAGRWESVKNFVSDSVDRIREGADIQRQIVDLGIEIENRENALILTRSELNRQIKEQNKIAEDITKTEAEREAAAIRSIELSKQLVNEEQAVLDLKIRQKELENSINETSREDQRELNELIAERNEKETQGLELQTTQTNKLNTIRQSAEAERQKAIDRAIAKSKEELELYIAQESIRSKSLAQSLAFEEDLRDRRLAILQEELDGGKISRTKFETEVLNIKKDFLDRQTQLTIENAQREIDLYILQNQSKIDADSQLTDELVASEEARLTEIYNRRLELLQQQRDAELITEQDFLIDKLGLQQEYISQQNELEAAQREQRMEIEQLEYDLSLETRRLRGESEFQLRLEELERQYQSELEYARKIGADTTKVDALFAEARKQIKREEADAKLEIQKQLFGGIADLLGKETVAGKAAGIAAATINTWQGVTEVWRAKSVLPEPFGTIQKVASTAVVLGSGFKAVKNIVNTKTDVPKAEDGMAINIGGNRHAQGGTKFFGEDGTAFEAEKGESMFILNRRASKALAPLLSDINQSFGGVSFGNRSSYLAAGGQVLRNVSNTVNNSNVDVGAFADAVAQANSELPAPIVKVAVEEINDGQANYAEVVNGANI